MTIIKYGQSVSSITVFDNNPKTEDLVFQRLQDENLDDSRVFFVSSIKEAVSNSDLIILASPIDSFRALSYQISLHAPKNAILTDMGSAKRISMSYIFEGISQSDILYVAAHNGNGSKGSGPMTACTENIVGPNSYMFLVEGNTTSPGLLKAYKEVELFWNSLSTKTLRLDVDAHDRFFGKCSHLPHGIVFSLMIAAIENKDVSRNFMLAGTALRNLSRIALDKDNNNGFSALLKMWLPIFMHNKTAILESAIQFEYRLNLLISAIKSDDKARIQSMLLKAREYRSSFQEEDLRECLDGEFYDIEQTITSETLHDNRIEHDYSSLLASNVLLPCIISYAQVMGAFDNNPDFISQYAPASFRDGTAPSLYCHEKIADLLTQHRRNVLRSIESFLTSFKDFLIALERDDIDTLERFIISAPTIRNLMPSPRKGADTREKFRCT